MPSESLCLRRKKKKAMRDAFKRQPELDEVTTGNLGSLHIREGDASTEGLCNFCTNMDIRKVHVVSAQGIMVRFCNACLKKIQQYRPPVGEK